MIAISCDKEEKTNLSIDKVSGYVQKGPYLNGTAITISELSSNLTPTGRNFTSQILDNKGTFEVKNIELTSSFVELKADGFYFNEILNDNSSAQLTLFALSDLSDKTSLNVNILSSLEKSRVEYLISNGSDFHNAKKQAQTEILKIFEIEKTDMIESENLDISKNGDENAILLSISIILQGYLSVAELSELLANISTDIREDGILNSQTLGSSLINNVKMLKLDEIRENLENRYETLGFDATIPEFEKYINRFIDSTNFEFTANITYPESGLHGLNVLDKDKTSYNSGYLSMSAILPEGSSLKVKIIGLNWYYSVSQDWSSWSKSMWNDQENSRTFTSIKTGTLDFQLQFEQGVSTIIVYENNSAEPTWSKDITIN